MKSTRTWIAHGTLAVIYTYTPPALYLLGSWIWRWPHFIRTETAIFGMATATIIYFACKEGGDEIDHKAEGEWDKEVTEDKVTYKVDKIGDLTGPFTNWLAAWSLHGMAWLEAL